MFILDTDHISVLERHEQPAFGHLVQRLAAITPQELAYTVVSFGEQARGWMAFINGARKDAELARGYFGLQHILVRYSRANVLPFNQSAIDEFHRLRHAKVKIGTPDRRIAAIARVNQAVLLSRNLVDFQQVPGLRVEDWSRPL